MGQALAHLTGTFHTQAETQVLNMKLDAPNMPVERTAGHVGHRSA